MSTQSEKDLVELSTEQRKLIDSMTVELAHEKKRADEMQEEARKAAAFVQAEQQRHEKLAQELAAAKAAIPAQTGIPVTTKAIEEIKDLLLRPVTEDDARAARDMLQSIHFDLSMADTVAIPLMTPEQLAQEFPVARESQAGTPDPEWPAGEQEAWRLGYAAAQQGGADLPQHKVPCGKTTGHGDTCSHLGWLCTACAEVMRLRSDAALAQHVPAQEEQQTELLHSAMLVCNYLVERQADVARKAAMTLLPAIESFLMRTGPIKFTPPAPLQPVQQPAPVAGEREAFEAWFSGEIYSDPSYLIPRSDDPNTYVSAVTEGRWLGWQARAALAAPVAVAAPVAMPAASVMTLDQIMDEAAKYKRVMVPLHITRAMQEVMDDEGWLWEDVLAAAEAITDEQYSEIQAVPAASVQPETPTQMARRLLKTDAGFREAVLSDVRAEIAAEKAKPQPDSGRDAALVYRLTPDQVRIIREGLDLFESDTSSIQDNATSERLQAYLATQAAPEVASVPDADAVACLLVASKKLLEASAEYPSDAVMQAAATAVDNALADFVGDAAQPLAPPFMYAIMGPDGKAYYEEHCVDPTPEALYSAVNALNDSPDAGHQVVPLYTRPQPAPAVLSDEQIDDACLDILDVHYPDPKNYHRAIARAVLAAVNPKGHP